MSKSVNVTLEAEDKERLYEVGISLCNTFPALTEFKVRKIRNRQLWRLTFSVLGDFVLSEAERGVLPLVA